MAGISADILTLIKFIVMLHILLHWLANRMVLVVVHDVCVCYILCVYASSTLYQRKLLCVQILVRVGGKSTAHWLFLVLLIVTTGCKVR